MNASHPPRLARPIRPPAPALPPMQTRTAGATGLQLPIVSFGASSLGAEFREIDIAQAMRAVHVALDCGMNFIDTSPYYGRGMSEVLLGPTLRDVPRDSYLLGTKLGRYAPDHFDFSARRVRESVDISLERMKVDHLDVLLCHDIEFVDMSQVWAETIPELHKLKEAGKVRFVGISGYPMKIFKTALEQAELDVVLSYNHYTLQNTQLAEEVVPLCQEKGVGVLNAAPFSARLLTDAPLPEWHKAPPRVREICRQASERCQAAGSELAKLALQFSIANPEIATTVTGSANPDRVRQWAGWAAEPLDQSLLDDVLEILEPIHNWSYQEGLPENNDPGSERIE